MSTREIDRADKKVNLIHDVATTFTIMPPQELDSNSVPYKPKFAYRTKYQTYTANEKTYELTI